MVESSPIVVAANLDKSGAKAIECQIPGSVVSVIFDSPPPLVLIPIISFVLLTKNMMVPALLIVNGFPVPVKTWVLVSVFTTESSSGLTLKRL